MRNKIVVADESLNFLTKYGYDVINLTDEGKLKQNNIALAKSLFAKEKLDYIFVMEHSSVNDIVNPADPTKAATSEYTYTLSENDIKNNDDYLSIMHDNINQLQKEIYK